MQISSSPFESWFNREMLDWKEVINLSRTHNNGGYDASSSSSSSLSSIQPLEKNKETLFREQQHGRRDVKLIWWHLHFLCYRHHHLFSESAFIRYQVTTLVKIFLVLLYHIQLSKWLSHQEWSEMIPDLDENTNLWGWSLWIHYIYDLYMKHPDFLLKYSLQQHLIRDVQPWMYQNAIQIFCELFDMDSDALGIKNHLIVSCMNDDDDDKSDHDEADDEDNKNNVFVQQDALFKQWCKQVKMKQLVPNWPFRYWALIHYLYLPQNYIRFELDILLGSSSSSSLSTTKTSPSPFTLTMFRTLESYLVTTPCETCKIHSIEIQSRLSTLFKYDPWIWSVVFHRCVTASVRLSTYFPRVQSVLLMEKNTPFSNTINDVILSYLEICPNSLSYDVVEYYREWRNYFDLE